MSHKTGGLFLKEDLLVRRKDPFSYLGQFPIYIRDKTHGLVIIYLAPCGFIAGPESNVCSREWWPCCKGSVNCGTPCKFQCIRHVPWSSRVEHSLGWGCDSLPQRRFQVGMRSPSSGQPRVPGGTLE